MPTYEYHCDKCGTFDYFQSMKDKALTVCPKCKGRKIKRLISAGAGFIFKGSGFYETDYRSSDYISAKKADTAAKPDSTPTKTDSTAKANSTAKPKTDSASKKDA